MSEHFVYSPDAAKFLCLRAQGNGCVELEAISRDGYAEVWLDEDGIRDLRNVLETFGERSSDG